MRASRNNGSIHCKAETLRNLSSENDSKAWNYSILVSAAPYQCSPLVMFGENGPKRSSVGFSSEMAVDPMRETIPHSMKPLESENSIILVKDKESPTMVNKTSLPSEKKIESENHTAILNEEVSKIVNFKTLNYLKV